MKQYKNIDCFGYAYVDWIQISAQRVNIESQKDFPYQTWDQVHDKTAEVLTHNFNLVICVKNSIKKGIL